MALVNVTNVIVLDNPTVFTNPFQFEVSATARLHLQAVSRPNPKEATPGLPRRRADRERNLPPPRLARTTCPSPLDVRSAASLCVPRYCMEPPLTVAPCVLSSRHILAGGVRVPGRAGGRPGVEGHVRGISGGPRCRPGARRWSAALPHRENCEPRDARLKCSPAMVFCHAHTPSPLPSPSPSPALARPNHPPNHPPTNRPTHQPTNQPTLQPTNHPFAPSNHPSAEPPLRIAGAGGGVRRPGAGGHQ